LLLKAVVHPANIQDRAGAPLVLQDAKTRFPRLTLIFADQAYTGDTLRQWVEETLSCTLHIVNRPSRSGWYPTGAETPPTPSITILPRRWVIERTIAWLGRYRRLSKDYEELPESEEAVIYAAMSWLMLRRLATKRWLAA
jgi:putative transposase